MSEPVTNSEYLINEFTSQIHELKSEFKLVRETIENVQNRVKEQGHEINQLKRHHEADNFHIQQLLPEDITEEMR
jgi:peptidoglycan hydrolase CwlO-like protein